MKILIITGGNSSERKISLISAKGVTQALKEKGHKVRVMDFKVGLEKIKSAIQEAEVIFPLMHGKEGEDGNLYEFLAKAGKPFVGSDPKGAKIAFDKVLFKQYCEKNGMPTAKWRILSKLNPKVELTINLRGCREILEFGFPCVLKAAEGGSSKEVVLLHSEKDLKLKLTKKILSMECDLYVEELLSGIEVTAGVLFNQALPLVEIVPPENSWFDYKNKYSGATREIPFTPSVNPKLQRKIQEIALKVHSDLNLRSFSRLDVIVVGVTPYVLEVNTPNGVGMTPESLFPKEASAAGIDFPELVEILVKKVVEEFNIKGVNY